MLQLGSACSGYWRAALRLQGTAGVQRKGVVDGYGCGAWMWVVTSRTPLVILFSSFTEDETGPRSNLSKLVWLVTAIWTIANYVPTNSPDPSIPRMVQLASLATHCSSFWSTQAHEPWARSQSPLFLGSLLLPSVSLSLRAKFLWGVSVSSVFLIVKSNKVLALWDG